MKNSWFKKGIRKAAISGFSYVWDSNYARFYPIFPRKIKKMSLLATSFLKLHFVWCFNAKKTKCFFKNCSSCVAES